MPIIDENKQVFNFVSNNMFKATLPNIEIWNSLKSCVDENSDDIVNLLHIFLPKMMCRFAKQRAKMCLQLISKKIVLNKSFDLIEKKCKEKSYESYRKPVAEIAELRNEWNKSMQKQQDAAYNEKNIINHHLEDQKYKELFCMTYSFLLCTSSQSDQKIYSIQCSLISIGDTL